MRFKELTPQEISRHISVLQWCPRQLPLWLKGKFRCESHDIYANQINTRSHAPLDLLWQFVEFSVCKIKCAVALSNKSFISASVLQSIPPFLSTFSICAFSSLCETEVLLFEHKHSCGLWLMLCVEGIWCLNALFCFCCVFFPVHTT